MNGINKITAKLNADAQKEIDAVLQEADRKCAVIRKEYSQKADEAYKRAYENGARAVEDRVQRLGSAAEMEAKKATLAFKQEMVSQAFDRAVTMIRDMPRKEYIAFLSNQAVKASGGKDSVLVFNPRDRDELGERVAKSAQTQLSKQGTPCTLTVAEDTRDIPGGLIVRQGDIEMNCAVDTLVHLARGELSAQVAEILFA